MHGGEVDTARGGYERGCPPILPMRGSLCSKNRNVKKKNLVYTFMMEYLGNYQ